MTATVNAPLTPDVNGALAVFSRAAQQIAEALADWGTQLQRAAAEFWELYLSRFTKPPDVRRTDRIFRRAERRRLQRMLRQQRRQTRRPAAGWARAA